MAKKAGKAGAEFADIAPASVMPYIAAQLLGAAIGMAAVKGVQHA